MELATFVNVNGSGTTYVYRPYYYQSSNYPLYSYRLRGYPYYNYNSYYNGYNRGYYNRVYSRPLYNSDLDGILGIFGILTSAGQGEYYPGLNTNIFNGDSIINQNQQIFNDNHHTHNEGNFLDGNGGHFDENNDDEYNHGSDIGSDIDPGGIVEGFEGDVGADVDGDSSGTDSVD